MSLLAALVWPAVDAKAQKIVATVPLPNASACCSVAVNPALDLIYVSSSFLTSGDNIAVVNGSTYTASLVSSTDGGVSVDMKNDNYWAATLYGGTVQVFAGKTNDLLETLGASGCPGETSFDCKLGRVWAGAQCGADDDPIWVYNANNFETIAGPIGSGGVQGPIIVNPQSGKLYICPSGAPKEISPTTFEVTSTPFGCVQAVDDATNRLFAVSGDSLQIVNGATDSILKTVTLTYSPGPIVVNKALDHLYVSNTAASTVEVRNDTTGVLLATISLPSAVAGMGVDSTRGLLYVVAYPTSPVLYVIQDLTMVRNCLTRGSC
ncbi:MAG TPA: hypothetical protein VKO18_06725 [Terriglobia bacterium]|nr:hypothetical protein [Terriglobia bacterium]